MDHQVALITGAGSGIGRALARLLAEKGVAIAALDIKQDGLQALADELAQKQRRCAWTVADVTDAAGLPAKIESLAAQLGPIDLLIASAGIGIETSGLNYRADDMNAVLNVNLLGVSNSIAAVLPGMLQRRRGHLVAMSSVASFLGMPRMLGYCASKAGLNALLEGLRFEVKPFGVTVTTVCPGWIRTPMTRTLEGRMPMMEVDDAARRILRAIERRQTFLAFPRSLIWRIRMLKWSPSFLQDWLIRAQMRILDVKPAPPRDGEPGA